MNGFRIGVVGLGNMGRGMALSLARAGVDVAGFDVSEPARRALADQGLPVAGSLSELIRQSAVLVLSLPTSDIVEQVVFGGEGILANAAPGTVVLDTTTADPDSTRRIAAALREKQIALVDGPVSGGPKAANAGTMTMVLGGEAQAIATLEPVLAAMTGKRVHVGPSGAGHVTKLLNNLLCGVHLLAAGEAVRIARAAGLDPALILDGINAGSGRSAVTQVNYPTWIFNGAFDSGFTMKLMRKDLRLAMALLRQTGAEAPLSERGGQLWADSAQSLPDEDDFNRIVDYVAS